MNKKGDLVKFLIALAAALVIVGTIPSFVSAQSCSLPCASDSDCKIDHFCNVGCCERIPCLVTSDCPVPCGFLSFFTPNAACNNCIDGFCVDPVCGCDFESDVGSICSGDSSKDECGDDHPACVCSVSGVEVDCDDLEGNGGTCHDCHSLNVDDPDCVCCIIPPTEDGTCVDDAVGDGDDTGCPTTGEDQIYNACSAGGTRCCIQSEKIKCNPANNECQPLDVDAGEVPSDVCCIDNNDDGVCVC